MGQREPEPVDLLPLVGGRLCLDFVNTTGSRQAPSPRERLATYDDLLIWSRRSWILGAREARAMAALAVGDPTSAGRALARALAARELLHRVFSATVDGRAVSDTDLEPLNRWIGESASRRTLVRTPRGLRWRWQNDPAELDTMLWPVLQSAVDLLSGDDVARLKLCGACDWLFLDTSKNRSRRWCKKTCGDRVKSRRYYQRRRQSSG